MDSIVNKATEHGPYTYNYDGLYRLAGGPRARVIADFLVGSKLRLILSAQDGGGFYGNTPKSFSRRIQALNALVPPSIYKLDMDLPNSAWLLTTGMLALVLPLLYLVSLA